MEDVLARLLVPDSEVIKQASADLRTAFQQPGVIPELCRILTESQSPQIRQYAAVLLRKKFSKGKTWTKFSKEEKSQLKNGCLGSLQREQEKIVISALTQLVATIAKHELGNKNWPELLQFIQERVVSAEGKDRVLAVTTVSVLAEMAGEQMKPFLKDFLVLFRKTLEDSEEDVCFYTIVSLSHFVMRAGSDEVNQFQLLIPTVLQKIQLLVKSNQDKATIAIDIFDELIENEVGIVIPHIKPMVELCIALASENSLDDPIRIKAVTFLGRLTRLKKKTIVKHKLYIPMVNVIFSIMATQEVEDDDDDAEDDDCPALAASQALDILAINLPPEKFMSALLSHVQSAVENPNIYYQRAGYQAIAVSAEGCQEYIRTKYLPHFLQMMGRGIRHEHHLVRNAALYMLGQFSEYIQPEISNYSGDILPVLLEYLDSAFPTLQCGAKESSSVSRIFYALDSFCENLEEKLVPHLPALMQRALASLNPEFSVRVRELGISLIGSAANAVKGEIIPYFESLYSPLHTYLTMEHTEDTQVLLTQSMSTLGILARCVGKEQFKTEFAEECIKIGMQLVEKNDDPDIRKCAYALFGAVASIVKEDMASVMEACVTLMLKTIQSTEGINLEVEGEDSNLPLEDLEEDEISLDDSTDKAVSDLEDVKAISVENAYVAEKEFAITALKDLSVECGSAFYPYLYQCTDEVKNMLDYPDDDVKGAAVEAMAFFLIAYYKSGTGDGMNVFTAGLAGLLSRLVEMVVEETEHTIVVSCLEAITELLKQCKSGVADTPAYVRQIVGCVSKIMKGECACQDQDDDENGMEEDEEEAEQDEMLFQYAGDVLPTLGRAMSPETFSPYFTGLFQMLLKKTKKQCSTAERSFAVGALADCMEPLQGKIDPYLKHLLPVFMESFKDSEDDVRNNGVYGVGELVLWGGPVVAPHYNQILSSLSNLLEHETAPRVVDQIVGAICRFIVAALPSVPLQSVLPVLLSQLPLKEDMDEYEMVFKAFGTLYSGGADVVKPCLPKIVECSVAFFGAKEGDKEKISPLATELLRQMSRDCGAELQGLLATLPPDTAANITALVTS